MVWKVGMPNLGFTMEKGIVADWLKAPGDRVSRGESIAVVETDKVTVEIEAPAAGILLRTLIDAGRQAPVAATIALVGEPDEAAEAEQMAAEAGGRPTPSGDGEAGAAAVPARPAGAIARAPGRHRRRASPVAERLAAKLGVALEGLKGSGPEGLITKIDILRVAQDRGAPPAAEGRSAQRAFPLAQRLAKIHGLDVARIRPTSARGRVTKADVERAAAGGEIKREPPPYEVVPLAGMRRTIAERMQGSWQQAPMVTLVSRADVTALMTRRVRERTKVGIDATDRAGGVQVIRGETAELGPVATVRLDAAEALADGELVLVAVPAYAHRAFAELTVPHLEARHTVLLFTGGLGAPEWAAAARRLRRATGFTLAETNTLPYAARLTGPAQVTVRLDVPRLVAGVFPAVRRDAASRGLARLFPQIRFGRDIVEAALCYVNGIIHSPVMLLNVSRIERAWPTVMDLGGGGHPHSCFRHRARRRREAGDRAFLWPGRSDDCRSAVRERLRPARDDIRVAQRLRGPTPYPGPDNVQHRFLTEDVSYFLYSILDLAGIAGINCPAMRAVIDFAELVTGCYFGAEGRTLARLGLAADTPQPVLEALAQGLPDTTGTGHAGSEVRV